MEINTLRELVYWAEGRFSEADLFYGHGTDNPHDEAVYLVFGALGVPFDADEGALDKRLDAQQQQRVVKLVDERIERRIPVAYLINEAWFAGLSFYVDERVLIPRSPIAELIEERFAPWLDEGNVNRILDIGSGSGAIAVACALAFPGAEVDAVDISEDALAVTRLNIQRHGLTGRVHPVLSDLFSSISDQKYDLIIANPPYVSQEEYESLPGEYRHEPVLALKAGVDGLDVVKEILAQADAHLTEAGILVVEVGNSREAVIDMFPHLPFIWLEFERGGEGVFLLTREDLATLGEERGGRCC